MIHPQESEDDLPPPMGPIHSLPLSENSTTNGKRVSHHYHREKLQKSDWSSKSNLASLGSKPFSFLIKSSLPLSNTSWPIL